MCARASLIQQESKITKPFIRGMVFVVDAYIFINSAPGMLWEIAKEAVKIEGVKMAHAVTGQFDVVAYAEFANMDMLRGILEKFQSLKGVERTRTAVGIPPRLR